MLSDAEAELANCCLDCATVKIDQADWTGWRRSARRFGGAESLSAIHGFGRGFGLARRRRPPPSSPSAALVPVPRFHPDFLRATLLLPSGQLPFSYGVAAVIVGSAY